MAVVPASYDRVTPREPGAERSPVRLLSVDVVATMQIDERTRREMYEHLETVLGAQTADALMAHLPLVGWLVPTMLSGVGLAFTAARFS